jgi:hypothetical protein
MPLATRLACGGNGMTFMRVHAASCEELRAKTGNPPLHYQWKFLWLKPLIKVIVDFDDRNFDSEHVSFYIYSWK